MKAKLLRPIGYSLVGCEVELIRPMTRLEREQAFANGYEYCPWWWTKRCGKWARPGDTEQSHLESEMEILEADA